MVEQRILHRVRGMVERGERITTEDCLELFGHHDLNEFSRLARIVRERRFGRDTFFCVSNVIDYRGEAADLFAAEIETVVPEHTNEVLLRAEWNDGDTFEDWQNRCKAFAACPLPIVLTLSVDFLSNAASSASTTPTEIYRSLEKILPVIVSGSGAGILNESWRSEHLRDALEPEHWLALHQGLHRDGIRTHAQIVYDPDWSAKLYVEHLEMLRNLQDETEGFDSITIVPYQVRGVRGERSVPIASSTLRLTTIVRLFLDSFSHIVCSPEATDAELSFVTLAYGVDTIDPSIQIDHFPEVRSQEENTVESTTNALELNVIDQAQAEPESTFEPEWIEERIIESRYRPIPVDARYQTLRKVELS